MVGVVVDGFVIDHRLYLRTGRHLKCSDLGLEELMSIIIVPMLLVSLVVIDVRLNLGMGCSFCFHNLLVGLYFQLSTVESC